jgi:Ti-type conjugative transfer relaxase TraA
MAIEFARIRYVSRSAGGSACNSSAYNARSKVVDERTGEVFDYSKRGGNVYHEILLPDHVDKKFKNISILSNEVERMERKGNSQLYAECLLPLDKDLDKDDPKTLEIYKAQIYKYIECKGWIKEGLGVQIDIHKPHDGEINWHCHVLVTTRRFLDTGLGFVMTKARDIWPQIRNGLVVDKEDFNNGALWRDVQNDEYKARGMPNRVDLPGKLTQEHIGPVRMRSVMNEAVHRNEERKESNIEYLSSGSRLIERVTDHVSVFNRKDLERAVKIVPDMEIREKLVEDALSSKSVINLYDEAGKDTGYYTTIEIRAEEEKILRLSGYVANQKNVVATKGKQNILQQLLDNSKSDFSEEQHQALSSLLCGESGIRILRGRAGTGKSHVLGKLGEIAEKGGVNVIGLAPTHKAKGELVSRGYEQNDTVKGMLFKLHNGRFDLPKNSLLVVDEAGMIGNDDFKELLRVAASRKCNVILSMDEKQLTSVQRGGMGEVLAERYGSSSILNIRRQDNEWGRSVAMAFSNGEVSTGISILQAQNKLVEHGDKEQSMQSLLADWSKSEEKISDRLIIAVKNSDVAALNHGARQYLKLEGVLSGEEIAVGGSHYMKGDRILIKETNKDLGLINGDFATVMHASKERFVVSLEDVKDESDKPSDNSKIVEFAPSEYRGFRHGYATTVFKAQGASIRDVYVFHDGFAGIRNSYVALSRNVNNLHLYINNQATKSIPHLIKQLGHDPEIGSSLSYFSQKDLSDREIVHAPKQHKGLVGSLVGGFVDYASRQLTGLVDKHMPDSEYYNYKAPELKREKVEEVLGYVAQEINQEFDKEIIVERAVVGGNSSGNILSTVMEAQSRGVSSTLNSNNTRQSSKEHFYANADYIRSRVSHLERKAEWDSDMERLRSEVKFKTESIARDLLGEPNKALSNGRHLRFGEHGKISVGISGEKLGSWYDFSADKGGDMFALVQDTQKCDFKESVEYLRKSVGMEAGNNSHLQLVHDHRNKDLTEKHIKAKAEEERINKAKAEQVDKLYSRAKDIGDRSVAYRYLTQERGLEFEARLTHDVKTAGVYVGGSADESNPLEKGRYLPAILAFARDSEGRVTGGQQILLNKISGAKASVDVPKKSFGKIAGSFVDLDYLENKGKNGKNILKPEVTIIAEGLETALSVRQALYEHSEKKGVSTKTLCSLGISNIKNYQPNLGEKIIIAVDNDGATSLTNKTIENAKILLEEKGAYVEIVRPAKEGDFNDVLKSGGSNAISKAFEPAISRHTAKTLTEYFTKDVIEEKFDTHDKSNLVYHEKYDLPQEAIVDAYRKGELQGKLELEQTRKGLEQASNHFNENKDTLKEARNWGYKGTDAEITKSFIGKDAEQIKENCQDIRNNALNQYCKENLKPFEEKKICNFKLESLKPVMRAEQEFLKSTYESLKCPIEVQGYINQDYLRAGQIASEKPEILEEVFVLANRLVKEANEQESRVAESLSLRKDMEKTHIFLSKKLEYNRCYRQPKVLTQERLSEKTIESVFEVIAKEQDAFANMKGTIVHHEFSEKLMQKIELAHTQRETNELDKLKAIASQSLESGAKTKESLLKDLQNTSDLKASREKIGGEVESHSIKQNLNSFEIEKNNAKEPIEAIKALATKQFYLSRVHEKLEYPQHLDKEVLSVIEVARHEKQENSLENLNKLVSFVANDKLYNNTEIVKHLKEPKDLEKITENLTLNYQSRYLQNIEQNLERIEKQGQVAIDKKIFDCPVKYLAHEEKHSHQEYAPQQGLAQLQEKVASKQFEMAQATKVQEQEVDKGMDFER